MPINTPISLDEESISINRSRLLSLTGSTFDISMGSSLTLLLSQGTWSQTLEVLVGAGGVFAVSGAKLIGLEDGELQIQALGRSSAGTPVSSATTTTQVDLLPSRLFINEVVAHTGEMLVDVSGTSQDVHQGAEVALTFTDTQGNTLDATATVQADGNWSLVDMDLTGLVAGTITVDATAVDNNGHNVVAVASDAEVSDVAPDQDVAVDMQYMVTTGNRLTVGADLTNVEDGRVVDVVLADGAGHSRTYQATVSNGSISLAALSTSEFTTPNLHITVRAQNSVGLIGSAEADALLVLAAPPKTKAATLTLGALQIDDQQQVSVTGTTTKVVQGTAVQIVLTDSHGNSLSTQGAVDANGVLNVQNISTVGLDEGTVSVQVNLNAAGKPMRVAQSFELVRNHAPEGTDSTASATEDVLYAISASDFGFTDLDSHSMTGVKITALPANGELKLNGAAVTLDQVISKADIDAGHLTFKAASNANGSNYASLQFKVQDSGSSHNEDTTANTLTFNVAAVNDAPTGSVTLSGTAKQGQTLTASHDLADADGMGSISYSWFANGVEISGATASTYTLTASEIGKTITVKASYTDGGNNATVVSSATTNAVVSSGVAGDGTISLGNNGQLIAPVQVEGKWYYHWDISGDGSPGRIEMVDEYGWVDGVYSFINSYPVWIGEDYRSMDAVQAIFCHDINGNVNPDGQIINETYRYGTLNGVQVALPTANGAQALPQGLGNVQNNTAASGGGTSNNSSYDDMLAIWDTANGVPPGWDSVYGDYWTATPSGNGTYVGVDLAGGAAKSSASNNGFSFALEVISTNNTAPILDPTQSPAFIASQGGGVPVGEVGSLLSTLVSGISDTSPTSPKGIAITGFDTTNGTLYFSTNGGTTWAAVGAVSNTKALLLAADSNTRLYFQPANSSYLGTTSPITFRAWDLTQHITEGVYANTAANGGKAEFSTATDTIAITVADRTPPTAPVLTLGTGVANGATSSEAIAGTGVVSVNAENGSVVVVTFTDHLGHSVTKTVTGTGAAQTITLDAADLGTGTSKLADGTITVSAVATDVAGNPSVAGTSSFTLDTAAAVAVADTSSANENNLIQAGSVKTNDTALDGTEQFTLVGSSAGAYGTLVLTSLGTYTYTYNGGIIHGITTDVVDTFTYQVTDAAGNTSTATLAITVTPVNDAPVNTVPTAQTLNEDTTKVIAGLSIADVDVNGGTETVTLAVGHGTVTVLAATGVTITGSGTGSVQLVGTVSAINAALAATNGVTYTPTANYNGTDTLTMTTHDGGNTGAGGAKSDTDTVTLNITAVNDAPMVSGSTVNNNIFEDTYYIVKSTFKWQYTDADGHAQAGVIITELPDPAKATLVLNDGTTVTPITAGTLISLADIDANKVEIRPVLNFNGDVTFKFKAMDVSASNNESSPVTVTYQFAAVNDAPTGSVTISGTAKQGQTLTASNSLADADGLGTISYSWFADGVAIGGATASTYTLTANEVGKLITAKASYTDGGNTATVVTSTASAAVASSVVAGDSVISLGAIGKLIAPVQVEGKWYYFWDRSGNGTSGGPDDTNHNVLDGIFKYDINGNANTTVANADGAYGTTDVYRYATINGVTVALPTMNGGMALPQGVGTTGSGNSQNGTAATTGGTSSFDELMAIWDTSNGTGTGTNLSGNPAGWNSNPWYWSATAASSGHLMTYFTKGGVVNSVDTNSAYIALQVISTPNTAPVLDATQSPALVDVSASASAPANGNTTAGVLVSSLTGGISDADSGASTGIAITSVKAGATLYYSLNGGTNWLTATGISDTNALLLAADSNTRVMYKSDGTQGSVSNAITFRAWDLTQHITEGVYASTVANGDRAQFSTANDTVAVNVIPPVVIDLNRDGVLAYGQVTMDVNGDGVLDLTKWAGAQDGVLVWDKYMDGLVHDNSQYAFAQYATTYRLDVQGFARSATDLEGLADAFDSNQDGVFNADDAKFAEFKVWQDANQNGVSDAGEVRSLSDWGIAEINLSSDGVVRTPTAGVTEAGRTTATATDGTRVLVSDAGFEYSSLAYSSETVAGLGTHIDLLGSGMNLDLSSVIAVHANVAEVNTSGTGANTLKIHLGDVLQGTPAGVLQVTGDADDTAVIKADEWLSTGNVVTDQGHHYVVYNAASGAAAQLLIDQHMLQQLV